MHVLLSSTNIENASQDSFSTGVLCLGMWLKAVLGRAASLASIVIGHRNGWTDIGHKQGQTQRETPGERL